MEFTLKNLGVPLLGVGLSRFFLELFIPFLFCLKGRQKKGFPLLPFIERDKAMPFIERDKAILIERNKAIPFIERDKAMPLIERDKAMPLIERNKAMPLIERDKAVPCLYDRKIIFSTTLNPKHLKL